MYMELGCYNLIFCKPMVRLNQLLTNDHLTRFPSVLCHCWLGDRKGIWPVKKLDVGGDDLAGALHDL